MPATTTAQSNNANTPARGNEVTTGPIAANGNGAKGNGGTGKEENGKAGNGNISIPTEDNGPGAPGSGGNTGNGNGSSNNGSNSNGSNGNGSNAGGTNDHGDNGNSHASPKAHIPDSKGSDDSNAVQAVLQKFDSSRDQLVAARQALIDRLAAAKTEPERQTILAELKEEQQTMQDVQRTTAKEIRAELQALRRQHAGGG
jgi:hypothetical protein